MAPTQAVRRPCLLLKALRPRQSSFKTCFTRPGGRRCAPGRAETLRPSTWVWPESTLRCTWQGLRRPGSRTEGLRGCSAALGEPIARPSFSAALRWRASCSRWPWIRRVLRVRFVLEFRRACAVLGAGRRRADAARGAPSVRCVPCCRLWVLSWLVGPLIRGARVLWPRDVWHRTALGALFLVPGFRFWSKRAR